MDRKSKVFEKVYTTYVKAIYRFIYFKVSDYELAYDITAETFLRFWKKLSEGKIIENNKAFLYFIAHGLIVDYYRKRKNKEQSLDGIDQRFILITDPIEDKIDEKNAINHIYTKLQEIKNEYRDVLLLYYVEELEIIEIAHLLKKKTATVRVLIHRALQALKNKL